jgi:glycosyltransferase involved in cell wall biosynthesis
VPLVGYFHTVKAMERLRLGEKETAARRYAEEKQAQLASRSDVVAVYSDFMRASVSETLKVPSRSIVEFMCGPTLPLEQRPEQHARPHDGFCVTYMGRLAVEKGVNLLLSAFLALSRTDVAPTLRILGSGPIAPELMARANGSPFSASIMFEPFTTDSLELMRAYVESDLIVVPSRFEPYGLVAAEALTLGVPVAVAATGGLPEIVLWGEYGDVFASDSVEELLGVLEAVRADRDGYLHRAARGREVHSDPDIWHDAVCRVLGALPGYSEASVG